MLNLLAVATDRGNFMHQRMSVRPELTIVPFGTFERTTLKEKLIERNY